MRSSVNWEGLTALKSCDFGGAKFIVHNLFQKIFFTTDSGSKWAIYCSKLSSQLSYL